ncbi:hypothetical protein HanRHA438_Chr12g0575311 [Helianthus annuus]|uniref:Uncharacterized protein n=1 Tax=Helianthus annuus TaxID=4232 RepID=A0A251T5F0_HELAN|nr:hypothetical protein HanXRQr2_Chr12g0564001 [Helianthus annuus]KAJ0491071.1 hypothetical protein HanHA300_Chr12g0462731 [Helianthus annuus]KAJ0495459.1 hypothetical protein HanIR_Chr12g0609021 [Helianthus annuus]KAJ0506986.1 hypothetical protein HanHA89_Chr12g0488191 [Helianthus annuus]KAJ0676616.1 hypothetical protein HanLR1_Chr12g0464771 [Helianthus annuus]
MTAQLLTDQLKISNVLKEQPFIRKDGVVITREHCQRLNPRFKYGNKTSLNLIECLYLQDILPGILNQLGVH